jgi:DNA-binding IclR family transcriptional regulator
VVLRALRVLDTFTESRPQQSLKSICDSTGLAPSTVHRQLSLLIQWGGVERVTRGRYQLSLHMWRLGSGVPQARRLRDVAMPFLEDLREATQEVVHLAVREELSLLYVEKLTGKHGIPAASRVSRRFPLYATGPGKVLLAHSGEEVLRQVVDRGLLAITPNTTCQESQLRRALAEVRRSGVAVSSEEMTLGACSIAAPVFGASGEIVASVSVVTPPERFDVPRLRPVVQTVGRAISRGLAPPHARTTECHP